MTKTGREVQPDLKREGGAFRERRGRPQMQIASELGIQPSMLRNWRSVINGGAPRSRAASSVPAAASAPVASPADQAAEIARLRRELEIGRASCRERVCQYV